MSNRVHDSDASVDALRMSVHDAQELIAQLDRAADRFNGCNRRDTDRVPYASVRMVATIYHPGGSTVRYLVQPRNLSPQGVGFLHGSYLHLNTRCELTLQTRTGRSISVTGHVTRCRFLRGRIHEVGVRLSARLDLGQFTDTGDDEQSVIASLPRLRGHVLCINDSLDDRELLQFILTRIGVDVTTAASVEEALTLVHTHSAFDLILSALTLTSEPESGAGSVAQALRERDIQIPVIALGDSGQEAARSEVLEAGCCGLLAKPFHPHQLIAAMLQFLSLADGHDSADEGVDDDQPVLYSAYWGDASMRPLIVRFLQRLDQREVEMQSLLVSHQYARLKAAALHLGGTAGGYGLPQIARAAAKLHDQAAANAAPDELAAQMVELADLCRAARRACIAASPRLPDKRGSFTI